MTKRIFNFSSGPAVMPVPVLERARNEIFSVDGTGMSVMEISHRSITFEKILGRAEGGIRELLTVPANHRILFLQGGATLQFSMVPMNFLMAGGRADYVTTGSWGKKALAEARKAGNAVEVFSSEKEDYRTVPDWKQVPLDPGAAYLHYTSNETIHGVQFRSEPDRGSVPVVCDMSSDILSRQIDVSDYAVIYAGAQKNIGPSGVTVVIVREEMLERSPADLPSMLNYRLLAENGSMLNTPNTWGIYMIALVCDWLRDEGGVAAVSALNAEKAATLYQVIDSSSDYYRGHAKPEARSLMNVTFRLGDEKLETKFCAEAAELGLNGLRGHRSVGGMRASIYNAFPMDGVHALADFMQEFAKRN